MVKFEHNGKEYDFVVIELPEDDCCKLWHEVYDVAENKSYFMDWSPYYNPTLDEIILWMDKGMPTRADLGRNAPFRAEDLEKYENY